VTGDLIKTEGNAFVCHIRAWPGVLCLTAV